MGETELSFPFTPSSLYLFYRKRPDETHRQMIKVLGVIMAPHVIQGSPLEGADDVADWRQAYNALPAASVHWKNVLDDVRAYVRSWYRAPGRADLVDKVAQALSKRLAVYGDKQWRAFVASCQPGRQAPLRSGNRDLTRLMENIICLQDSYDWCTARQAGALVHQSW
jgi:hypothetical protein